MFNKDVKVPLQEAELVGTSTSKKVHIAFNILPDGGSAPIGYQKIPCHMIFDVKMEDFQQKAQQVAGGHLTKAPATITYASVVSCETVRLALTFAP